jgi:hypothetical protein
MSTTTDGTQLSPCVELFIELLLDGASAVTSREVAIVRQSQDVVTHFRTGLCPNDTCWIEKARLARVHLAGVEAQKDSLSRPTYPPT